MKRARRAPEFYVACPASRCGGGDFVRGTTTASLCPNRCGRRVDPLLQLALCRPCSEVRLADPLVQAGARVSVYWPGMKRSYTGNVVDVRIDRMGRVSHKVHYPEDGDVQWHAFQSEEHTLRHASLSQGLDLSESSMQCGGERQGDDAPSSPPPPLASPIARSRPIASSIRDAADETQKDDGTMIVNASPTAQSWKADGIRAFCSEDFVAAVDLFSKSLRLDSRDPSVLVKRASALCKLGYHDRALADAQAALRFEPHKLRGYLWLSHALLSLNRPNEAHDAAKRGLAFHPGSSQLKELLRKSSDAMMPVLERQTEEHDDDDDGGNPRQRLLPVSKDLSIRCGTEGDDNPKPISPPLITSHFRRSIAEYTNDDYAQRLESEIHSNGMNNKQCRMLLANLSRDVTLVEKLRQTPPEKVALWSAQDMKKDTQIAFERESREKYIRWRTVSGDDSTPPWETPQGAGPTKTTTANPTLSRLDSRASGGARSREETSRPRRCDQEAAASSFTGASEAHGKPSYSRDQMQESYDEASRSGRWLREEIQEAERLQQPIVATSAGASADFCLISDSSFEVLVQLFYANPDGLRLLCNNFQYRSQVFAQVRRAGGSARKVELAMVTAYRRHAFCWTTVERDEEPPPRGVSLGNIRMLRFWD